MSDWKHLIQSGPVWTGVEGYAQERIDELTKACVDPESSHDDIRRAQWGIAEMRKLIALPGTLRASAEIKRAGNGRRTEY